MSDIKAGYAVEITTWENDADAYNTVRFDGLVKDEVEFYLAIARLFTSRHNRRQGGGFGNQKQTPNDEIRAIVGSFIEQGKKLPKYWNPADWVDEGEEITPLEDAEFGDNLYDVIGSSEYGYYRVFDEASVYYVPELIKDIIQEF